MFRILGTDGIPQLASKLEKLGPRIQKATKKLVIATAIRLANRARTGIHKGTRTGNVYDWEVALPGGSGNEVIGWKRFPNGRLLPIKKRATPHQASAPGEYPKTDKGTLANSIMWDESDDGAEVGTDHLPGLWLEEGTRYMKARPWLEPTVEAESPLFYKNLSSVIVNAIKGG